MVPTTGANEVKTNPETEVSQHAARWICDPLDGQRAESYCGLKLLMQDASWGPPVTCKSCVDNVKAAGKRLDNVAFITRLCCGDSQWTEEEIRDIQEKKKKRKSPLNEV